jgi:2-C-methyl-D-erythritol 2,4-cyclodiphosphate synthase
MDITIVAREPRLAPYRDAMRETLASALGVLPNVVSMKATTTDGVGALGRGEGILALATALLSSANSYP